MANREQLSLRELELLQELNEIAAKTDTLSSNMDEKFSSLDRKDVEIAALKRKLEEYKRENEHLCELIQTWRSRMDNVLKTLGQINN
ncbi:MAG: hypothetical protein SOV16_10835 [Anaerobiospirillum succiniciproducens]|uniref:hypothetical protein n=1 Tax=Anaerobiospirillum succiniciproducens TaxID=13335 RepID=UPI0003FD8686|nr:hypothetical protein [Anaerobiospirillum succiniciproducens]MCI6863611.1 hypothetical protein [Anaerobiospirillum succiniciproducens]MDO4676105.1 hypothetical protein [Anaerobiospirillum succiniciproducens]MDY2799630.1 hypothetical protein [Anaerobiospirillum succiniciproducens]